MQNIKKGKEKLEAKRKGRYPKLMQGKRSRRSKGKGQIAMEKIKGREIPKAKTKDKGGGKESPKEKLEQEVDTANAEDQKKEAKRTRGKRDGKSKRRRLRKENSKGNVKGR